MSLFGLITPAYAQAAGGAAAQPGMAEMLQNFAPLVIIVGVFYFLLFRPQQQRAKQLREQIANLRRGDSVVTAGGIIGTIARVVNDDELAVDIAEGVRVRVVRSTITGINTRGEAPAAGSGGAANSDGDAKSGKKKPAPGGTAS